MNRVTDIINHVGGETTAYTYDAFGNLISQIGESDNAFLYCSEYFDSETQTYYLLGQRVKNQKREKVVMTLQRG